MNTDMGCTCSCDYDGEACDIYNEKERTARKSYLCQECKEMINPGDRYIYAELLYDGSWTYARWCISCQRIKNDLCPCAPIGELVDEVWYSHNFNYVTGEFRPGHKGGISDG